MALERVKCPVCGKRVASRILEWLGDDTGGRKVGYHKSFLDLGIAATARCEGVGRIVVVA